jgi:hypothetical protein
VDPQILFFIFAVCLILGVVMDFVTTIQGTSHGMTELSPWWAALSKKIGQSGTMGVAAGVVMALLAVLGSRQDLALSNAFLGGFAASEIGNVIRNIVLLKKKKIGIFS